MNNDKDVCGQCGKEVNEYAGYCSGVKGEVYCEKNLCEECFREGIALGRGDEDIAYCEECFFNEAD